jgi:parallel beta-helix repeat protein
MDRAYNNSIFHSTIGLGTSITQNFPILPNGSGGILLGMGTSGTTVGGIALPLQNVIQSNANAGLYTYNSTQNGILNNLIQDNTRVGVYAVGFCTGTLTKSNTVQKNGTNGTTNIAISQATGIIFTP